MAEAEDVITDAARYATDFARGLWLRHRPPASLEETVTLKAMTTRLDLLTLVALGRPYPIRSAQLPAPPTLLARLFRRAPSPHRRQAIPATDGTAIWLPPDTNLTDRALGAVCYRCMALQQATRASRGSARWIHANPTPLQRDVYLLLEAYAADVELADRLPGSRAWLAILRRHSFRARPPLSAFSPARRSLERLVRRLLQSDPESPPLSFPISTSPSESLSLARTIVSDLAPNAATERAMGAHPLLKDWWTGDLTEPTLSEPGSRVDAAKSDSTDSVGRPRSTHLPRRPAIRKPRDGEDHDANDPDPWMVQLEHPHQLAEDPMGLQRPTDRDDEISAEELASMVSDLSEARLVNTPGRPREVLLSDDPPPKAVPASLHTSLQRENQLRYPEWDYRVGGYRFPGATVHLRAPENGPQQWVDAMLTQHRSMLTAIRRRFEMLRAKRLLLRRRLDGEEVDLLAYLDSYADFRAGLSRSEALYQTRRPARRSLAITLLIDVSGSTDSWISGQRRVIDVEREALLLVCSALDGMGEPYTVQAFSGDGPDAVNVWELKHFAEPYGNDVARRIAALEPERYTRTGAAVRHSSAVLLQQPASHRLLLLLSDGKPNDLDEYAGRYGVEDLRQAVVEARLQGIFPFCLTIDRQAADYLPHVFGAHHWALLPRPELLPTVLLDWMKRLLVTS